MMTIETVKQIAKAAKTYACNISRFTSLSTALGYSRRTVKMSMTMQVEGEFWVVTPAEAQRLNRLGYEYAPNF